MILIKRTLPLAIAFVCGLLMIASFFIPHQFSESVYKEMVTTTRIIYAFAALIGLISLLRLHWKRIAFKREGYGFSLLFFGAFLFTLSAAIYNDGSWFFNQREHGGGYPLTIPWIYDYVFLPAGATMFSILAFFIASASFRTFRARTLPATLLLLAATVVMLGRVPVGAYISEHVPILASWLMDVPNAAVKRAIFIGVALGVISTSLRIIFGIERTYLGGE